MLIRVLKEIGISNERTIIERGESEWEEIRGKIKEMKEEIQKYYKTSGWNSCKYGIFMEFQNKMYK